MHVCVRACVCVHVPFFPSLGKCGRGKRGADGWKNKSSPQKFITNPEALEIKRSDALSFTSSIWGLQAKGMGQSVFETAAHQSQKAVATFPCVRPDCAVLVLLPKRPRRGATETDFAGPAGLLGRTARPPARFPGCPADGGVTSGVVPGLGGGEDAEILPQSRRGPGQVPLHLPKGASSPREAYGVGGV